MNLLPNVQNGKMKIEVAKELTAVVVILRYYRRGLAPNRYAAAHIGWKVLRRHGLIQLSSNNNGKEI